MNYPDFETIYRRDPTYVRYLYGKQELACNCSNDGAKNGYRCAIKSHYKWYQDVLEATEKAIEKEAHRELFNGVLNAIKESGKKPDASKIRLSDAELENAPVTMPAISPVTVPATSTMQPLPAQTQKQNMLKLNLTTVYDISKISNAIAKEIANNAEIIKALTDLKAQVLTLKDQKRDIIELTEDVEELFAK
jgi:hypothetical protein